MTLCRHSPMYTQRTGRPKPDLILRAIVDFPAPSGPTRATVKPGLPFSSNGSSKRTTARTADRRVVPIRSRRRNLRLSGSLSDSTRAQS